MLEVDSSVVSLGRGRLAIYLPSDLVNDSAFEFRLGDRVKIKADGSCVTVNRVQKGASG